MDSVDYSEDGERDMEKTVTIITLKKNGLPDLDALFPKPITKPPIKAIKLSSVDLKNPTPSVVTTTAKRKEITKRLLRGPSVKDGQGLIYVYLIKTDDVPKGDKVPATAGYYKIGMTTRELDRRMSEWGNATSIFSKPVKRAKLAEVIIHWLLDSARVYRYIWAKDGDKKTYLTRWKTTSKFVRDATWQRLVKKELSLNLKGKKRNIEWFVIDRNELKDLITRVVRDINAHYADEPWKEFLKKYK
jgi:hypothetical protein